MSWRRWFPCALSTRPLNSLAWTQKDCLRAYNVCFRCHPAFYAWVAVSESALIGYATATIDFSTWRGAHFVHMDCLYVQQLWRGSSIGNQLINAIKAFAMAHQLCEIQWQTPLWNERAAKFYQRLGAEESIKRRFKLCTA